MSGDCKGCDFSYALRVSRSGVETAVATGSNLYCMHSSATIVLLGEQFPMLASRMREEGRECGPRAVLWTPALDVPTLGDGSGSPGWTTVKRNPIRASDLPPGAEMPPPRSLVRRGVGHSNMKPRKLYEEPNRE
jgi:hypothetical protein